MNLSTGVAFSNLVFRRITPFCGEWVRGKHRGGDRESVRGSFRARARQEGGGEVEGKSGPAGKVLEVKLTGLAEGLNIGLRGRGSGMNPGVWHEQAERKTAGRVFLGSWWQIRYLLALSLTGA